MYFLNQAKNKMQQYIDFTNQLFRENYPEIKWDISIIEKLTEEHDFGWIFFYQSNNNNQLAGNGPMIIEKKTLDMYQMMTGLSIEDNIKKYLENKNNLTKIDMNENGIWDTVNLH
jgi:hypothetical protein